MKKMKLFLLSGVSLLSYVAVSNSALGESSEAVISGKTSIEVVDSGRNTLTTTRHTITTMTTTTAETTTAETTTTITTSRTTAGPPVLNPGDDKKKA